MSCHHGLGHRERAILSVRPHDFPRCVASPVHNVFWRVVRDGRRCKRSVYDELVRSIWKRCRHGSGWSAGTRNTVGKLEKKKKLCSRFVLKKRKLRESFAGKYIFNFLYAIQYRNTVVFFSWSQICLLNSIDVLNTVNSYFRQQVLITFTSEFYVH